MKKLSKQGWFLFILIVLHAVGLVGLNTEYRHLFNSLTPLNLLISALLVFWSYQKISIQLLFGFLVAYGVGCLSEMAGTNTGVIFGIYSYEGGLGYELFNTPLIIGINWFILIAGTAALVNKISLNKYLKISFAALFMVLLDFLIEPIAILLKWWNWESDIVPVQNYIAWFLIAWFIHWIWEHLAFEKANKLAIYLYFIQIVFFIFLNLLN